MQPTTTHVAMGSLISILEFWRFLCSRFELFSVAGGHPWITSPACSSGGGGQGGDSVRRFGGFGRTGNGLCGWRSPRVVRRPPCFSDPPPRASDSYLFLIQKTEHLSVLTFEGRISMTPHREARHPVLHPGIRICGHWCVGGGSYLHDETVTVPTGSRVHISGHDDQGWRFRSRRSPAQRRYLSSIPVRIARVSWVQ